MNFSNNFCKLCDVDLQDILAYLYRNRRISVANALESSIGLQSIAIRQALGITINGMRKDSPR